MKDLDDIRQKLTELTLERDRSNKPTLKPEERLNLLFKMRDSATLWLNQITLAGQVKSVGSVILILDYCQKEIDRILDERTSPIDRYEFNYDQ